MIYARIYPERYRQVHFCEGSVYTLSRCHSSPLLASRMHKVDEQLFPSRNRCAFLQYMSQKPWQKPKTKMPSSRWPLGVFCSILDLATLNASILWRDISSEPKTRFQFSYELKKKLISRHQHERAEASSLHPAVRPALAAADSDNFQREIRAKEQTAKCVMPQIATEHQTSVTSAKSRFVASTSLARFISVLKVCFWLTSFGKYMSKTCTTAYSVTRVIWNLFKIRIIFFGTIFFSYCTSEIYTTLRTKIQG